MLRIDSSSLVVKELYCLYHRINTYTQRFLTYNQEDIFDITPPIPFASFVSTVPIVGVRKSGAQILFNRISSIDSTPYFNYFEAYWLYARGFLAVNAFDAQLRDLINTGLTRGRLTV